MHGTHGRIAREVAGTPKRKLLLLASDSRLGRLADPGLLGERTVVPSCPTGVASGLPEELPERGVLTLETELDRLTLVVGELYP